MGKFVDLVGRKFGRLTVVRRVDDKVLSSGRSLPAWLCACSCGSSKVIAGQELRSGRAASCGCWQRLARHINHLSHGDGRHGAVAPEYRAWVAMRQRCNNPTNRRWEYYGARGIRVCERWARSYEAFLADMGRRPTSRHSIDRIDVNGNYEPENCRWATPHQQNSNRRFPRARPHAELAAPTTPTP